MLARNLRRCASAPRVERVYVSPLNSSSASLTTYTFTGVSLGSATGRSGVVILAGQRGSNSRTINSATVAGNAATRRTQSAAGIAASAAFTYTGTEETATVTVTLSGSNSGCIIFVYAIYNADSMAPVAADSVLNASTVASVTLTDTSRSVALAISATRAGTPLTASWTNITGDAYSNYAGNDAASAASADINGASAAVTATLSGTPNAHALSAIAIR